MKDPIILKLLDSLTTIFNFFEVDYQQVRLILKMKFFMDKRKKPSFLRNIRTKPGKEKNMFIYSMFFYAFMGLMMLPFIAAVSYKSLLISTITFFTVLIVFLAYAIIIEFSMDFFDSSDHNILLSKPFTLKELNVAKSLHIMIYMLGLALSFSLPALVFWAIKFNVFVSIISLISVFFCLLLLFFCCALFYSFILNKFSGEKLKDTLTLIQVASIILIFIGYQLFLQESVQWLENLDIENLPVLFYLLPPTWFALPGYMVGSGNFFFYGVLISIFGIVLSTLGYAHYIRNLSPLFEKNLYKMKIVDTTIYKRKEIPALKVTSLFRQNLDKAFYRFSVIMLNRERKLKQAIYPLVAMALIYPLFMLYRFKISPDITISGTKQYFLLYFTVMMILPLSIYTGYSEYYEAAWIYKFLPIKFPGRIIKMSKLAMLFSYQFLIMFVASIPFLIIWEFTIITDVLIIWLNALIIQGLYENMAGNILPFSVQLKTGQNSAFRTLPYFLTVFIFIPLTAGIHFALNMFLPTFYWILIPLQMIIIYLMLKHNFNIGWDGIKS